MLTLNIIYFTIALILLMLVFLVSSLWQKQHQIYLVQQQKIGINFVFQLRELFKILQQHRGLAQGILKGHLQLEERLVHTNHEVNLQIAQIKVAAEQVRLDLTKQSRWESIIEHWFRFSTSQQDISAENSLQQHNKLVLNTLYLIDDIASQFHLHKLVNDNKDSIRHIWLELLFSVENLGQIRALGTGIAAAKNASHVEAIRLNYLSHSLQHSLQHYFTQENNRQAEALVDVINDQLLQSPPTIAADEFFDLASQCIDAIFLTFDKQLHQFDHVLNTSPKLKMVNNAEHY